MSQPFTFLPFVPDHQILHDPSSLDSFLYPHPNPTPTPRYKGVVPHPRVAACKSSPRKAEWDSSSAVRARSSVTVVSLTFRSSVCVVGAQHTLTQRTLALLFLSTSLRFCGLPLDGFFAHYSESSEIFRALNPIPCSMICVI